MMHARARACVYSACVRIDRSPFWVPLDATTDTSFPHNQLPPPPLMTTTTTAYRDRPPSQQQPTKRDGPQDRPVRCWPPRPDPRVEEAAVGGVWAEGSAVGVGRRWIGRRGLSGKDDEEAAGIMAAGAAAGGLDPVSRLWLALLERVPLSERVVFVVRPPTIAVLVVGAGRLVGGGRGTMHTYAGQPRSRDPLYTRTPISQ